MSAAGHLTDPQIELLVGRYARELSRYEGTAFFVEQRLRRALRAAAIRAQLCSRAKHPDDLREKLHKRRADPRYAFAVLREDLSRTITDLAGCRVMVYHPADAGEAAHVVRRMFRRAERDDADEDHNKPSGDLATHILVSIGEDEECLALHGAICEIQVTTIAAHLFTELEHEIRYKDPSFPLTAGEAARLDAVRGASLDMERLVGRLLDEHAEAVRQREGPLACAEHLKSTLERSHGRPLRGDFARLYLLLSALVQPLTPSAVDALGPVDDLLERGQARAGKLDVPEPDDVICLVLALCSTHGAEIGALAAGWPGPERPLKRAIQRALAGGGSVA